MEQELQQLKDYLLHLSPLREEIWQDFAQGWEIVTYKRKTILTAASETESYLYFVLEGIQRGYFLGPDGRNEATIVFTYPPSFSGVADSFLTETPSTFYLETITASRLMRLPRQRYTYLCEKHPAMKDFTFRLTAEVLRGVLARLAEIQSFTAEEKFRTFLARSPHMLNLVPHKYLASYLNLDPSTFSRLLSTVKL